MCLAGGKRLEVNTYEMASKSREAETKDSENKVKLKTVRFFPFPTISRVSNTATLLPMATMNESFPIRLII